MGSKRGYGVVAAVIVLVGAAAAWGVFAVVDALDDFRPSEAWQGAPEGEAPPAPASAAPAAPLVGPDGQVDAEWLGNVSAVTGIPDRALTAYVSADLRARADGCAVGWNTLAGIGWVESRHGSIFGSRIDADGFARPDIIGIPLDGTDDTMAIPDTDGGALDGDAVWDRAVGPMQFIPETWSRWAIDANGDGIASPHSIDDVAATAAAYLCRLDGSLEEPDQWIRAIRSYNDTLDYQLQVADAAVDYAAAGG